MFHVITAADKQRHAAMIDEMHAWRKTIFVDENRWDLPHVNGREYDEYDDEYAIYILEYEANGDLVHSQRMRPTLHGSMVADIFGSAIAAGPDSIADDKTWEMTRGFVTPKYRVATRDDLRAAMRLTILQLAQNSGMSRIVNFIDVRLLPYFINSAYRFKPLGLPIEYGQGSGIAVEIEVSTAAIAHMAETLNVKSLLPIAAADSAGITAPSDTAATVARVSLGT